jgi:hypothetical protein
MESVAEELGRSQYSSLRAFRASILFVPWAVGKRFFRLSMRGRLGCCEYIADACKMHRRNTKTAFCKTGIKTE